MNKYQWLLLLRVLRFLVRHTEVSLKAGYEPIAEAMDLGRDIEIAMESTKNS